MVAVTNAGGAVLEHVRYTAHGVPSAYTDADLNLDGEVTFDDTQLFNTWFNAEDPRADLNADLEWTFEDTQLWVAIYNAGESAGRGVLSRASVGNRLGYAGYRWDAALGKYMVRHRVYDPFRGR